MGALLVVKGALVVVGALLDVLCYLLDVHSLSENLRLLSIFLISLLSLRMESDTVSRKPLISAKKTLIFFSPRTLNCITNKVNKKASIFTTKKTKNINEIIVLNPSESRRLP